LYLTQVLCTLNLVPIGISWLVINKGIAPPSVDYILRQITNIFVKNPVASTCLRILAVANISLSIFCTALGVLLNHNEVVLKVISTIFQLKALRKELDLSKYCIFGVYRSYKELFILAKYFNMCYRHHCLLIGIGISSGFNVAVSVYFLTSFTINSLKESLFLAFLIIIDYITSFVLLKVSSQVNSYSLKVLDGFKLSFSRRHSYVSRCVKSLQPLKVLIGDNNFVEKSTPLCVASFNVENTVSFALTVQLSKVN